MDKHALGCFLVVHFILCGVRHFSSEQWGKCFDIPCSASALLVSFLGRERLVGLWLSWPEIKYPVYSRRHEHQGSGIPHQALNKCLQKSGCLNDRIHWWSEQGILLPALSVTAINCQIRLCSCCRCCFPTLSFFQPRPSLCMCL